MIKVSWKKLGLISAIIMWFIILVGLNYFIGRARCLENYSQYQPSYGLITQCVIHVHGKKIPSDNFKVINYD